METLIAPTINLLILLVILFTKLRQPFREFVTSRHHSLRKEVDASRELLKSAQEKFREFSGRLQALDQEVAAIRSQTREDAQAAKQRIVEAANKSSTLIVADARGASQALVSELRRELYGELSARVLEKAESLLKERLTGDDRARIRQEFSKQLESATA